MNQGFRWSHLVCEVPHVPAVPEYAWYEIDLDGDLTRALWSQTRPDTHVIAATRQSSPVRVRALVGQGIWNIATHIQFEFDGCTVDASDLVRYLHYVGLEAIPAWHLEKPPRSQEELYSTIERLASLPVSIIKLVYPVGSAEHLEMGMTILRSWPDTEPALSLTPAGSRQARLAAALAGSRLVYAPLEATVDRMPASWWRALVTEPSRVVTESPEPVGYFS